MDLREKAPWFEIGRKSDRRSQRLGDCLNPNSEIAVAIASGGTGHRPVPSGDSPLGTGVAHEFFCASVAIATVLPVPSGQWPDGTGGSPMLPQARRPAATFQTGD